MSKLTGLVGIAVVLFVLVLAGAVLVVGALIGLFPSLVILGILIALFIIAFLVALIVSMVKKN